MRALGPLSVFRRLDPFKGLTGLSIGFDVAVLLGLAVMAAVAAIVVFDRRDL